MYDKWSVVLKNRNTKNPDFAAVAILVPDDVWDLPSQTYALSNNKKSIQLRTRFRFFVDFPIETLRLCPH